MKPRPYRFLLLFLVFIIFNNTCLGQKSNLRLTGRIIDEKNQPVIGATVSVRDSATKKVKAVKLSDKKGQFEISPEENTPGSLLSISYIGYNTDTLYLKAGLNTNLGSISLKPLSHTLQTVQIVGQKNLFSLKEGVLNINVEGSITAQGESAFEVLQKSPGVSITRESDISLNGKSGMKLFLDGKMVYLEGADLISLLKSLPSSSIKSIDLISNPSAKYDAAGSGGIINIHTKKGTAAGFNSSTTLAGAYGYSFKQNTDENFNYRNKKINIYGNYSHLFGDIKSIYSLDRVENGSKYLSNTIDTDKRNRIWSKLGVDYEIDDKQIIGILLTGNFQYGPGNTYTTTDIYQPGSSSPTSILRAENDYYKQIGNRYNSSIDYRWQDTLGQSFIADVDYGYYDGASKNLQPNSYFDPATNNVTSTSTYRSINSTGIKLFAVKADYEKNIQKATLSAGAKYSIISSGNNYDFYNVIDGTPDVLDNEQSNNFNYKEKILSGYINYSIPLNKFKLQAGLRVENTNSDGLLIPTGGGQNQENKRSYTDAFPSASISFNPGKKDNFSVGYSRRIDRPAYQDLNPFVYLLDELSFWQGNPFLRPQLTNKFYINFSHDQSYFFTLDYSHTSDFFASLNDTLSTNKIIMTPKNGGTSDNVSLTASKSFQPFPWWSVNGSASVYYIHNDIFLIENAPETNLHATAWSVSAQQSFNMPYKLTSEISAIYNSSTLSGINSRSKPNGELDLGLQRKVLNNDGIIRLSVSDVLLTSRWNSMSILNNLDVHSYGYTESRRVRLSFTYRFGSKKLKDNREHQSALEAESDRIK